MPQVCSICKHERRPEIDKPYLPTNLTGLLRNRDEREQPCLATNANTFPQRWSRQTGEGSREAAVLAKVTGNEVKEEVQAESLFDQLKAIRNGDDGDPEEAREPRSCRLRWPCEQNREAAGVGGQASRRAGRVKTRVRAGW